MQQNCKKGLCLAFLFSAMFLTGWEIAGMRSRQTKETGIYILIRKELFSKFF